MRATNALAVLVPTWLLATTLGACSADGGMHDDGLAAPSGEPRSTLSNQPLDEGHVDEPDPDAATVPPRRLGDGERSAEATLSGLWVYDHVRSFADHACTHVGACGNGTYNGHDPHSSRAVDSMVSPAGTITAAGTEKGDRLVAFATNNRAKFGIMYVIWKQRINSFDGRGWRPMGDRGSVTQNHFDHVHVSFLTTANPGLALDTSGSGTKCAPRCEGTKIFDASCGSGDCAAFAATCVNDALGARCVSVFCPAVGAKKVCLPDGKTLGTCKDGGITTGDCGAFGATCVNDALGARCVSVFCPAIGEKKVCLPDGHTIGSCKDGGITTGDCAAFGTECRDDGGARCAAPHAAALVGFGSDAPVDPSKVADFRVCAGKKLTTWIEFENVGTLTWTDEPAAPPGPGKAVRLGTFDGNDRALADAFTKAKRASVAESSNPQVRADGGACTTKGCARTRFLLEGIAPTKLGPYATQAQLVDEGRTWFGPTAKIRYDVVDCSTAAEPAGPPSVAPPDGGARDEGADGGARGEGAEATPDFPAATPASCAAGPSGSAGTTGAWSIVALGLVLGLARRRAGARQDGARSDRRAHLAQ